MSSHALLSPSSAHRWMACPGSVLLSKDIPNTSSSYAEEGNLAHEVASAILLEQATTCEDGMLEHVSKYVELVRGIVRDRNGTLLVEQRVDMSKVVPGCWGTSDAIIVCDDELIVIDLKYGMGVRVDAEGNEQLRLYGLGAYLALNDLVGPFKTIRTMICQPRLDHVSEEVLTADQLTAFSIEASLAAEAVQEAMGFDDGPAELFAGEHLTPSEDACRWCPAKATCPALRAEVQRATGADFYDVEQDELPAVSESDLSSAMKKVGLIEDWCKAVRAAVETALFEGKEVDGFKLVEGRKGARQWADADAVEQLMKKQFRLPDDKVYDFKLISPTTAEKLFKDSPRRWTQLQEMVTQVQGKPSVAPVSDKRPAYRPPGGADDYSVED